MEEIIDALWPVVFQDDAELVACSDSEELERLKSSSVTEKLWLTDNVDELVQKVCEQMGSSRRKYRAVFYYLMKKSS
jgi:hypothetical protein